MRNLRRPLLAVIFSAAMLTFGLARAVSGHTPPGGPPDAAEPLPLDAPVPAVPASSGALPAGPATLVAEDLDAPAAVLMDALTGRVLLAKAAEEPRPPASITKLITILLAYEAVAAGEVAWDDQVVISPEAQSMGGTQAFLAAGQRFSLADLLKAVAVASANDAAVAIAEHVAGSADAFVERMNARAAELGMTNTQFTNPHGLDDPGHAMSARDVAVVSRALLRRFPEVLDLTSIWTYTFEVAENCCLLTNTNKMVRRYSGVDGLKTGWTSEAGYGVSATVARQDTRLIAVIMGHEHPRRRFEEAARLLDWGLGRWRSVPIVGRGDVLRQLPVYEGRVRRLALVAAEDFGVLVEKASEAEIRQEVDAPSAVVAPVAEGRQLGVLRILQGERELGRVALVADRDAERLDLPGLWWRLWRDMHRSP